MGREKGGRKRVIGLNEERSQVYAAGPEGGKRGNTKGTDRTAKKAIALFLN